MTPFERLVAAMLGGDGVTFGGGTGPRQAFGATSLKTEGRIFAMLVKGKLVVKLDRRRFDGLVAAGEGDRFDPGHGRIQKEWLVVRSDAYDDWLELATDAEAFVSRRAAPA